MTHSYFFFNPTSRLVTEFLVNENNLRHFTWFSRNNAHHHRLNLRPTSICIVLHIITQLVALYKSVMSVVTTNEKWRLLRVL